MNPEKTVRRYAKNPDSGSRCINGSKIYKKSQVSETETMTIIEIKKMQKELALLGRKI